MNKLIELERGCQGSDTHLWVRITPLSQQIDQFFAPDGTLISIPVKPAKKIAVLKEIAKKLSPDTKYPEKELNAVIKNL